MQDQDIERVLKSTGAREKPPAQVERAVREELRAEWRAMVGEERAQRRRRVGLALAAGFAVAAVGVWIAAPRLGYSGEDFGVVTLASGEVHIRSGLFGSSSVATGDEALITGQAVETGPDGRSALGLPGGLSLRLDGDTRVRLVRANGIELERGAVYVDAGSGSSPATRLDVATAAGTVRHVGTQYEIRLVNDDVRLRVREGRVEWQSRSGQVAEGRSGEQLTIAGDGTVARLATPTNGETWDWIASATPGIAIDGLPLAEFLAWAARELGHELRFAGATTAREAETTILHGSINGLAPREALTAVLETTKLRASVAAGRVTIDSREDPAPLAD